MRLFHRCKHLWILGSVDKIKVVNSRKVTAREKYICSKCGRIKHRRIAAVPSKNDLPQYSSEWKSTYNQKPIYKEQVNNMDNKEDGTYSALEIAKYVIAHCIKSERPIDYLQLPKILYYLQGYFLAVFGKPLFNDSIYAWKSGPMIHGVHNQYSYFGADPIYTDDVEVDLEGTTPEEHQLIDAVIDNKALKPAWQLMADIHREMPWKSTKPYTIINRSKLKRYFYEYLILKLKQ